MAPVKIYDQKYGHFEDVDWDFKGVELDSLSSIHPYPARFINEIPRALIDKLGCPADKGVLDPFCGSGTTLVEAQRKGLFSVGVDLNPIACLISSVKVNPISEEFMSMVEEVYSSSIEAFQGEMEIPHIPNLDHWFKKDIQKALSCILACIERVSNETAKNALKLALSSIIVRVSNQESDTRYAAIDKNHTAKDVFENFKNAAKKLYEAKRTPNTNASVRVIESDILNVLADDIGNNIGLVITSPPYPNAYEYWLYHKYRMWWLGFDPISVRTYEIGARPHYMKKNGQTEVDFYNQMDKVFDLLCECLITGGHICFVIGRSVIKGREINNADLITDIAKKHGLDLVVDIEREIASTKKSFNLTYGKIKTENILVYRKG